MKLPPLPKEIQKSIASRRGILKLVGNTPLVELDGINPNPKVKLYAKVERTNPGGSVKDRVALSMVEAAEREGLLRPGMNIVEATSGNTGIGLAICGAVKGYKVTLVMQEAASAERKKTLAALGANLWLTPSSLGVDGAIELAYQTAKDKPDEYFLPDQYNNPNNPLAHYYGTSLEMWQQTQGKITHFVAGMGTSGTLMGNGRRLRELNPDCEIVCVEPYLGHKLQGMKNLTEAYIPGIFDKSVITQKVRVDDDTAFEMSRSLARTQGLFVGMSAGAAVAGAVELARQIDEGVIVVLLPDGGGRYLSTSLFTVEEDVQPSTPRLSFLNTLTRRVEPFKPIEPNRVRIYACGPTAHALPHLGLMRRIVAGDLVRRSLEWCGNSVEFVMNITDIDDKTLAAADASGEALGDLTERYIEGFHRDLDTLNVRPATSYPRASAYVDAMIQRTDELIKKGTAYVKHKSVYFDVSRYSGYGRLSRVDLSKLQDGATVDLDSYAKDSPHDFTLVKRSTLAEIRKGTSYRTEWGQVRPAWHIECAAIALEQLGSKYDIHFGGHDLMFPHHENEIAVCESLTGEQPANFWMHSGVVVAENGTKMSHSLGNAVSVRDLLAQGYSGREIRFFLLSTNYRQPLRYSPEAMAAAATSLRRLSAVHGRLARVTKPGRCDAADAALVDMKLAFTAALYDDLNIAAALAELFSYTRRINRLLDDNCFGQGDAERALEVLRELDEVLGTGCADSVDASAEVHELVEAREEARVAGRFEEADALRNELATMGVSIDDGPDGPRLTPLRAYEH